MTADPHRPQFHFQPPANWMNDPNGLIQSEGLYHLFYQHNPNGPVFGAMHWGHAVSRDLVHWEHWPIALAPTPCGPDGAGCWSGCAVDANGVPTIVYTAVHPQTQCVASSADGMRTWSKDPANPVVAGPPDGVAVLGFRDPCVWREGSGWRMLVGSGIPDLGGTVFLYRSADLRRWEYVGPLLTGDPATTGTMWECPDFFSLGGRQVLVISPVPLKRSLYMVGDYAGDHFVPSHQGEVDGGGHFYAPQTLRDDRGRRLMWGWLWEGRSREAQVAAGWAGVMSLPRVLTLQPDGTVGWAFAEELTALRSAPLNLPPQALPAGEVDLSDRVYGDALELRATFAPAPGATTPYGLWLRGSPRGEERTLLAYSPTEGALFVDRSRSSLGEDTERDVRSTALALTDREGLSLHLYLDHSVLEVVANGRACLSSRVYPTRADSLGVGVLSGGGTLQGLQAWTMGAIW